MTWINTNSGKRFYYDDITKNEIDIHDVAHALSHMCRYNGHTDTFYSVAEHAVNVSYMVPEEDALEALHHDDAEAFICDLVRPFKHMNDMSAYRKADQELERHIAKQFGLRYPWPQSVKDADEAILLVEKRELMSKVTDEWEVRVKPPALMFSRLYGRSSAEAKSMYLQRHWELTERTGS